MSSSTQVTVTPRVSHQVRVTEEDVISVEKVLGAGGVPLLREALNNLPATRRELGVEATTHLAWTSVGRDRYQLAIEDTTVELLLEGSLAHIHVSQTQTLRQGARGAVSEERIREAHRSVNDLFATVAAQRIQERMKTHVAQRATVSLQVAENRTMQAFARFRVG